MIFTITGDSSAYLAKKDSRIDELLGGVIERMLPKVDWSGAVLILEVDDAKPHGPRSRHCPSPVWPRQLRAHPTCGNRPRRDTASRPSGGT